ncbi:MAG: sigma-70 region 4 domain-containing protein [Bacteroidetes bacterium]|nr:sigma-70 region 4 domain-containing protein [Bacteroidota bacterium]
MDDQPVDEIAAITGLSSSNVKVKLFRARKKASGAADHDIKR